MAVESTHLLSNLFLQIQYNAMLVVYEIALQKLDFFDGLSPPPFPAGGKFVYPSLGRVTAPSQL